MSNNGIERPWRCTHELNDVNQVHYCDYISLEKLMELQYPHAASEGGKKRDFAHVDEHQFVVIHQMFELMFSLHICELRRCAEAISGGDLSQAMHCLSRILHYVKVYTSLILAMGTMRPDDFAKFRDVLSPASGAESEASRVIEILSGIEPEADYASDRGRDSTFRETLDRPPLPGQGFPKARWWTQRLTEATKEVSLAKAFNQLLISKGVTLEDLYEASDDSSDLYRLAELLFLYETTYLGYRKSHHKVVTRQIGTATGTGHTSGGNYLASVVAKARFFPKLTALKEASGARLPRVEV